jgi:hypothetical protein
MKQTLPDRDDLLTRDETAVALTAAGYPIRSATLGTKATRGGGPPCRRFGTRSVYRWGDAIDWAEGRMAPSRTDPEPDGGRSASPGGPQQSPDAPPSNMNSPHEVITGRGARGGKAYGPNVGDAAESPS